jgi:hypothetical protein
MSDIAERGVKFLLLAELAPSAKAIIDDFAKTIKGLQAQVDELTVKAATATAAAVASASNAASASAQKAEVEVVRSAGAMSAAMEASVPTGKLEQLYQIQSAMLEMKQQREEAIYTNSLQRMEQAYEEYENAKAAIAESAAQRTADLLDFMDGKTTEMPDRGGLNRDEEQQYLEAFRKQAESAQAEFEKIEAKRVAQSNKSVEDELNRQIKEAEGQQKTDEKKAESAKRTLEKKEEAAKKAADKENERIDKLVQKAIDADNKELESAKRKDEQKIRLAEQTAERQMERAHAAARQVVSNALEMGESVMRIARGFAALGLVGERELGKVTDAVLKAQAAMDFMMGISRTIQKLDEGYRLLRTSIMAAAAAQEVFNVASATGVAVGAGGGGAEGALAAGAAGGAGGSLVTRGVIAGGGYAAAGLGALGGGAAEMTGLAVGAGVATAGALVIAALAALAAGITSTVMVIKEANEGGSGVGEYSETVGGTVNSFLAYLPNVMFLTKAYELSNAGQQNNIDKLQGNVAEGQQRGQLDAQDEAKILSFEQEVARLKKESFPIEQARKMTALEMLSPLGKQSAIMQEISRLSKEANSGDRSAGEAIIKWQDQRLRNEQQIASVKIQSAQEAIRLAQSEIVEVERKQAAIISANQSAAERFGLLDDEKQQEIIQAKQRLNTGGASVEDLRLVQGFSGSTDERIKQLAQQRARNAGFGIFEQEAANEVKQLEGIKRKLEIEVKQKTDFIVRIDEDQDRLAARIAAEVARIKGISEKQLSDKINEALKEIGALKTSIKQRNAS